MSGEARKGAEALFEALGKLGHGLVDAVVDAATDVVEELDAAYDQWWDSIKPQLVNENAVGPKVNPFKELYWKQFGGGPDEAMLKKMDPAKGARNPNKKANRKKREAGKPTS